MNEALEIDHYREIIAVCLPELAISSCALAGQGWDSLALLVNRELIFRLPKRAEVGPQYLMEARLLAALDNRLPLEVPRFSFVWPGGATYPHAFVGYRLIAGEPLEAAHLTGDTTERVAGQLAAFLSALHDVPLEEIRLTQLPAYSAKAWRQHYRNLYAEAQARVFPLIDRATQAHVAADWHGFLETPAHFQFAPALLHRDLSSEHILYDVQRGALSGIIDWGDAAIGDPAIDFTGLLDDYERAFADRVLARYTRPADATFLDRAAFYWRAMPVYGVLFGLQTNQPALVEAELGYLRDVY